MTSSQITIEQAKTNKLFYFVANVVVYRELDGRCLILQRSHSEKVHPGKYCVPGGKLEWENLDLAHPTRLNGEVLDFENIAEDLLKREVQEEAGIEIEQVLSYINSVAFVRPDGIPVVLIKFAAKYKAGDVKIEAEAFDNFAWVNEIEVENYDCIMGVKDEIKATINKFKKVQ